jgi:phospholipase/carboxylesterase
LDIPPAFKSGKTRPVAHPNTWLDGGREFNVGSCSRHFGTWGRVSLEDLRQAAESLLTLVDEWSNSVGTKVGQFDLMGFSQGAAMVYTLALFHPDRVRRMAALAGFVPEDGEAYLDSDLLSGKPVFVSHGRQDKLIPVDRARRAVALLHRAGAEVTYCESDAEHKVAMECTKEMNLFFGGY